MDFRIKCSRQWNTVKGVEGLNRASVPHCGPLRGLRAISRLTIGLVSLLRTSPRLSQVPDEHLFGGSRERE